MGRHLERHPGVLVSFEGLERVGKSTQIAFLADWLRTLRVKTLVLREPGHTELGETLRRTLLHDVAIKSPRAELLLFAAARAELVATQVVPGLERGLVVILDRFIDSSVAYQGYGSGVPLDVVEAINHVATNGLLPDVTFWLDGQSFVRESMPDQIESRDADYFSRVREGYRHMATSDASRWQVMDANQSPDVIHHWIREIMQPRIIHLQGGQMV